MNKPNQVVQVLDEKTGQVVYTLRIRGNSFRPKVFAKGKYTVKVGEGEDRKTMKGIQALPADDKKTLKVEL